MTGAADVRTELDRIAAQGIHDARCGCGQGDEKGIDFYRDHAHLALNAIEEAGYAIVKKLDVHVAVSFLVAPASNAFGQEQADALADRFREAVGQTWT